MAGAASPLLVECDVLPGLEDFLRLELGRRWGGRVSGLEELRPGSLRLRLRGRLADLLTLSTAQAAYLVLEFAGQRPTVLLGHENLQALLRGCGAVLALPPRRTFASFRLGAAGSGSSTFRRLAAELEARTGLRHDPEAGELLVRVLRSRSRQGWDVLLRLSPRPLSARRWRVRNLPGALNATIAAAMVELTRPRPGDRFVNLACGSATLLVERLLRAPAREAVGCDLDPVALEAARANLEAAGLAGAARLLRADATDTGLPAAAFDAVVMDPPYGNLVGSHRENEELYPRLLAEAARLTRPGGGLVVITHEVRLFEASLHGQPGAWRKEREVRVFQGGAHPRIYMLRRFGG